MSDLSQIAQKIKEAYNAGYVDALKEERGREKHHASDEEYAHRKANELWVSDYETDFESIYYVKTKYEDEDGDYMHEAEAFEDGAIWLRDRLFEPKNEG